MLTNCIDLFYKMADSFLTIDSGKETFRISQIGSFM